jgi:hypothetical protein
LPYNYINLVATNSETFLKIIIIDYTSRLSALQDKPKAVRQIADFLGRKLTDEDVANM